MYMKLYSIVYNVANILEWCLCFLAWLVVIYYKVKFFVSIKVNHCIAQTYVDQALESLEVPIPRAKITILCSLLLLVHSVSVLLGWYDAYILKHSSSTADFINVYERIYFLIVTISHLILFQYGYVIITFLRQRLQLTRRAFKRLYKCDNRTVAWSHSAAVATVGQPRYSNSVTDIHNTYELLGSVYRVVYESLLVTSQQYSLYFQYYLLGFILCTSAQIVSVARNEFTKFVLFADTMWISMYVALLFMYMSITIEVKHLQNILNCFYHKRSSKSAGNKLLVLAYQSAHRETKFNCGFVDTDFSVFSIVVNFIPLIVFNIL